MILISTDFNEVVFIPKGDCLPADGREGGLHLCGEYIPAVLGWTDEVVENTGFVVSFQNMLVHAYSIAGQGPPEQAPRKSL